MKIRTKEDRRDRIKLRLRKRIVGTAARPRLTVFRSLAHIYVQVVDDAAGQTLASASTVEPAVKALMDPKTARRQHGRRRADRPHDRRAADRQGAQAGRLRPQRVPVPRPGPRGGRGGPEGGAGVLVGIQESGFWSQSDSGSLIRLRIPNPVDSGYDANTRENRPVAARPQGHRGVHQPRHQGRQGRQEPELQRPGGRRGRARRRRVRRRQGARGPVGHQEGDRGRQEER